MICVACAGDNCIDYYEQTGEAYPGGNSVNVAVYLKRLGAESSYIGAVGTDRYGALLLEALRGKKVDVSHVRTLPGTTALTHVNIENGERILGKYDEGVMADFRLSSSDMDFICGHDMVVSGLWGRTENALKYISACGIPVAFDCAEQPESHASQKALPHASIAFFSDDGSDEDALRRRIRTVSAQGPKIVVATRGSLGSLAFDGKRFYSFGAIPCRVVDTMGAGDSYIAGFILAHLSGMDISSCMEAGAASSCVTLGYKGAW